MTRFLLGHRGAAFEAPENTLTGFAHAWKAGVRAFELDVRLSADQQLVVLHDESLERTAGFARRVGELTAAELAGLDARAAFPEWPERAAIPRLEEVLQAYHVELHSIEVEIKTAPPDMLEIICPLVAREIERFRLADRAVVTSFDAAALGIMRRISPGLRRRFISHYDQPEHLEMALRLGCYRTCIPLRYSIRAVAQAARAAGLNVTGWQGDSPEMLAALLDWDVDNITTNRPSQAIPYLRERGWISA